VVILLILTLLFIALAGCMMLPDSLLTKESTIIFKANSSGHLESATSLTTDWPGCSSRHTHWFAQTSDEGLIMLFSYCRDPATGKVAPGESGGAQTMFKVVEIQPEGYVSWEANVPTHDRARDIGRILEYPNRFDILINGSSVARNLTIYKPTGRSKGADNDAFPLDLTRTRSTIAGDPVAARILHDNLGTHDHILMRLSSGYVLVEDKSTPDWDGVIKLIADFVAIGGISNVRDDGFRIDVTAFDENGSRTGGDTLSWQPSTRQEHMTYCPQFTRKIEETLSTPDGGFFVVGTMSCSK
jgi:hypothetical protein